MCDHDHNHHHDHEHPKDRPGEPDDPMLLMGTEISGDPEVMIDCLIEEFARLGWDGPMIERLFDDRSFQATAGLRERFGREGVRQRIERTLQRCGVMRYSTVEAAAVDEAQDACSSEVPVRVTVRGQARATVSEGDEDHA